MPMRNAIEQDDRQACVLCGSLNSQGLGAYGPSGLTRCSECGFVYRSEVEGLSALLEHYAQVDPHEIIGRSKARLYEYVLDEIERRMARKGRLLDIGCNYGFFLKLAGDRGWTVHGVEILGDACAFVRDRYSFEVFHGYLKDAAFPSAYFDVVTLCDVIAHLSDPLSDLSEVFRILRKDGGLFIRTRNVLFQLALYVIFMVGKRLWTAVGFTDPSVFCERNFSPSTIRRALRQAGFRPIVVRNSYLTKGDPYGSLGTHGRVADFFKVTMYVAAHVVYVVSHGRLVIGPSLDVWAVKR